VTINPHYATLSLESEATRERLKAEKLYQLGRRYGWECFQEDYDYHCEKLRIFEEWNRIGAAGFVKDHSQES